MTFATWESLAARGFTAMEAAAARRQTPAAARQAARRGGFRFVTAAERRLETLRDLAAQGLTTYAAGKRLGMDYRSVCRIARQHGIAFPAPSWSPRAWPHCRSTLSAQVPA